ncbi:MAG: fluoride efflux transporter CrcB [Methylacidiphilales bacterium]|nr:fluoride efflux transporter CrcB [Candidatus Methylacidiphilales bacterium]
MIYIYVMVGGALGTLARFLLSAYVASHVGETFPWGTLLINVTGSFAIGFFGTLTDPDGALLVRPEARTFFMIGICGGYTTFSSFSLQTLRLAQNGQLLYAGANIIASNVGCLLAVWLGYLCAANIRR